MVPNFPAGRKEPSENMGQPGFFGKYYLHYLSLIYKLQQVLPAAQKLLVQLKYFRVPYEKRPFPPHQIQFHILLFYHSMDDKSAKTIHHFFYRKGRGVTNPFMVENGCPDVNQFSDKRTIASFLGEIEIPARGEHTIVITLGQTTNKKGSSALVKKYQKIEAAQASLETTKKWWRDLMGTVTVETSNTEFNYLQNWLKYQAIAERIWAKRGFYQTSGAFGFRDQLQDTVNLMWVDPSLSRKQIILHASQQFLEGDVLHWFFTTLDGRTAFANLSMHSQAQFQVFAFYQYNNLSVFFLLSFQLHQQSFSKCKGEKIQATHFRLCLRFQFHPDHRSSPLFQLMANHFRPFVCQKQDLRISASFEDS